MRAYLLRRLLLMIPTLFGITVACFVLIQMVPGGPVEEYLANVRRANAAGNVSTENAITPEELQNIKAYFGFDQPAWKRYFIWLGKICRLDFGTSYSYNEPVWDVIVSRFPISLFFGLTSFILSYLICIPLGIYKAIYNGSKWDSSSSTIIFAGYVIPGYALGILLIIFFAGGSFFNWFPIGGIVSDDFETMGFFGKTMDFLHHMVLPLICYVIDEFAVLTILMKNSVLEELKKDYIRTAIIKGNSLHRAVWKHAVRNAFLPVVTRMSEFFTILFAGSILIERVFDIDGMGLLSYNAILSRDYNVVMGIIILSSFLFLLGRLFADIFYVILDPRIHYR